MMRAQLSNLDSSPHPGFEQCQRLLRVAGYRARIERQPRRNERIDGL